MCMEDCQPFVVWHPSLCSGWHHANYAHLVQALWHFPRWHSLVFIISRAAALKIHTFSWETGDRGQLRTVSAHTHTTICKTWADGSICLLTHGGASACVCVCVCGWGSFYAGVFSQTELNLCHRLTFNLYCLSSSFSFKQMLTEGGKNISTG